MFCFVFVFVFVFVLFVCFCLPCFCFLCLFFVFVLFVCLFCFLFLFSAQVVLLDECSQMTEPASLLPIARFECEKLVLVGDPKQLDPTIQGSEPGHDASLEQTLFDRLLLMVRNLC